MEFTVLLMAGDAEAGELAPGLAHVGGISLLERQVRALLKKGARRIWLLAPDLPDDVAAALSEDSRCVLLPSARALAERTCRETAPILHLAPGLLIDDRLLSAILAAPAPALLVFGGDAPAAAERLDSNSCWGGAALLPAALVTEVAAGLGDWDLTATLIRKAAGHEVTRVVIEDLPTYAPARRRDAPMLWAMPRSARERQRATNDLLAAAQKGCLDWPARFIHPPVENALVRLVLETPAITPNGITVLTAVLGAAAIILFAVGQPLWALILLLVVGPLDGVDGKLARVRHQFSRWGDLEHVLDKIVEYGAILALAAWLARAHGVAAWLAAGGIIVFALVEALSGEFFRRFTGRQLDDWGTFERRFRLIGGRRNTFFWTLLPFGISQMWWAGFLVILAYSAVTFGISFWRFCLAIGAYGRRVSPEIEKNFTASAYDFLPKPKAEAT